MRPQARMLFELLHISSVQTMHVARVMLTQPLAMLPMPADVHKVPSARSMPLRCMDTLIIA